MSIASIEISRDSYVDSALPTTNLDGPAIKVGKQSGTAWRGLLYTSLIPAIPSGATINSAELQIRVTNGTGGVGSLLVQKANDPSNWTENQVSWNKRNSIVSWGTPGIDVDDPPAVVDVGFFPGAPADFVLPGLAAIVKDALDNEAGNFAVRLKRSAETAAPPIWFEFADHTTGIQANRPLLVVDWDPAPVAMPAPIRQILGGPPMGHRYTFRRAGRGRLGATIRRAA